MEKKHKSQWTISNVLTVFRLLLIPVFVYFIANNRTLVALGIFALASFTDFWDGYLARKLDQVTNFGKLMDPLADKMMVLTALIAQAVRGVVPWAALGIVAAKEIIMITGGLLLYKKGTVVHAKMIGKVAQVCFILSLMLTFFHEQFASLPFYPDQVMLWLSVGLTLCALCYYMTTSIRAYLKEKN